MDTAEEITQILKTQGADLIGFADLTSLPASTRLDMPTGIAIAAALRVSIVEQIADGPTKLYFEEYERLNELLSSLSVQVTCFLKERGYQAVSSAATNEGVDHQTETTLLPHKTVATLAGLGWIGKCALLITREYGAAVRINRILTDAPLPTAEPILTSACGKCNVCVDICPGHAPSGKEWVRGCQRDEFFNAYLCRDTANQLALGRTGIDKTFCGICIAACPWTKKYIKTIAKG